MKKEMIQIKKIFNCIAIIIISFFIMGNVKAYGTYCDMQVGYSVTTNWNEVMDGIIEGEYTYGLTKENILAFVEDIIANANGTRDFNIYLFGGNNYRAQIVVMVTELGEERYTGYVPLVHKTSGVMVIEPLSEVRRIGTELTGQIPSGTSTITGYFTLRENNWNLENLKSVVLQYINTNTELPTSTPNTKNIEWVNSPAISTSFTQFSSYNNSNWISLTTPINSQNQAYTYEMVPLYSSRTDGFKFTPANPVNTIGFNTSTCKSQQSLILEDNNSTYTIENYGVNTSWSNRVYGYVDIPTYWDIYYNNAPVINDIENKTELFKSIDFSINKNNIYIDNIAPTNNFSGTYKAIVGNNIGNSTFTTEIYGEYINNNVGTYELITSGCSLTYTNNSSGNNIEFVISNMNCTSAINSRYNSYYVKIKADEEQLLTGINTNDVSSMNNYNKIWFNTTNGILQTWNISKFQNIMLSGNYVGNIWVQNNGVGNPTEYWKYNVETNTYTKLNGIYLTTAPSYRFKEVNNENVELDINTSTFNWYRANGNNIIKNTTTEQNILIINKMLISLVTENTVTTSVNYTNNGTSTVWWNIGTTNQSNGTYTGIITKDGSTLENIEIVNESINTNIEANNLNDITNNIQNEIGSIKENSSELKQVIEIIWGAIPIEMVNILFIVTSLGIVYLIWKWVRK